MKVTLAEAATAAIDSVLSTIFSNRFARQKALDSRVPRQQMRGQALREWPRRVAEAAVARPGVAAAAWPGAVGRAAAWPRAALAALALALFLPVQQAQAQATAGTVTMTVQVFDPGDTETAVDRSTAAGLQAAEGDFIDITVTANGLTDGRVTAVLTRGGDTGELSLPSHVSDVTQNLTYNLRLPDDDSGAITLNKRWVVTDDAAKEGEHTVTFTLADSGITLGTGEHAPTPASFTAAGTTSVTVTILASDARTLTVTGPATVNEGANAEFTIALAGDAFSADTDVTWTVMHGPVTRSGTEPSQDADFDATTGTVSFGASDGDGTNKTFNVPIASDTYDAGSPENEQFYVVISLADPHADGGTVFGGAVAPGDSRTTVFVGTAITDLAPASITLSLTDATALETRFTNPSAVEDGQPALITVTPAGAPPATAVTVTCTALLGGGQGHATIASFRAGRSSAVALSAGDPLPTDTLTFTAANWFSAQYCAIWTFATATGAGSSRFWVGVDVSGDLPVSATERTGDAALAYPGPAYSGDAIYGFSYNDLRGAASQISIALTTPATGTVAEGGTAVFEVATTATTQSHRLGYIVTGEGITPDDFSANFNGNAGTGKPVGSLVPGPFYTATRNLSFAIADDDATAGSEGCETFTVTLLPPPLHLNAIHVVNSASVTIGADDGSACAAPVGDVAFDPAALNVAQGGQVSYTAVLDINPGAANTITVTPAGDVANALTFAPASLTFTAANWNTAQTVLITAARTGSLAAQTVNVTHTVAGATDGPYNGVTSAAGPAVTVAAATAGGFALAPATLELEQGLQGTYTLTPDTNPGAGNTVTVTPSAAGLTFVPASAQFTADNWETALSFTVTAVADGDTAAETVTIAHSVSAAAGLYQTVTSAAGPTVTIAAFTGPSVRISGPDAAVAEGNPAVFTIAINQAQSADVTVPYTIAGAGITAGDVHGGLTGSVVIERGDLSARLTVHVLVDGAGAETGDMLTVTLGTPTVEEGTAPTVVAAPGNAATVDIADSSETDVPTAGTVTVTAVRGVSDGAPGADAVFRIALSGFRAGIAEAEWETVGRGSTPVLGALFVGGSTPTGTVRIPAGHAQSGEAVVRLRAANRLTDAATYGYTLRVKRVIQYTDAGQRPDPVPGDITEADRVGLDATITVAATSAALTVQRAAGDYIIAEEPSPAEQVATVAQGGGLAPRRFLPGRAAVFRVDLCEVAASGCRALTASQPVNFEFAIGGSNNGPGVDYMTPYLDRRAAGGNAIQASASGANWRTVVNGGESGLTIVVALVDDDVAELNETLNLRLVGAPTVGAGGGTVSLAAAPGNQSLDYTITGAEPAANPAGSIALNVSQAGVTSGSSRNGRRIQFAFTLTDDDAAAGDDTDGADADYRLWYAFYASNQNADGFRLWSVLDDADSEFNFLTDDAPLPARTGAVDPTFFLNRELSDYGGAPKGYGYVILRQGESAYTLDVLDNAFVGSSYALTVFAVDDGAEPPGDTALPDYDLTSQATITSSEPGNADTSPAFFNLNGHDEAQSEGDTQTYAIRFRGAAPTDVGGENVIDADNPVIVTWRILGSNRHGTYLQRHPATVGDVTVTGVTLDSGQNIAFIGNAGTNGIGTVTSDAARGIIAEQRLQITGWPGDNPDDGAFSVDFTVTNDNFAEPIETFTFQVISDHPELIGEIPGDGSTIAANDPATVAVEAIRGTDTDGDETDGSWQEAPPSANDNPLRFRLSITGGRPQQGATLGWRVAQKTDGGVDDVTAGDFLRCVSDDCASTRSFGSALPSGFVETPAAVLSQSTGPWLINLPFTLHDDGVAEMMEDFTVEAGVSDTFAMGVMGINADGNGSVDVVIAASGAGDSRLAIGIGAAACGGPASAGAEQCSAAAVSDYNSGKAVNDRPTRSDFAVGFPLALFVPDGDDADTDPDPLSAAAAATAITAPVTLNYTVSGTIFDNGAPGPGAQPLSAYPRAGSLTLSAEMLRQSVDSTLYLFADLPQASVSADETFIVTVTEVTGNDGGVSLAATASRTVTVRHAGGTFSLSGGAAAGEGDGALTYTVSYDGAGMAFPAEFGGATLDWEVIHAGNNAAEAADAGLAQAADFTGDTSGDNTLVFAAGVADGAEQTFTVTLNDDPLSEGAEAFTVRIGGLRAGGADYTGALLELGRSEVTTTIAPSDPQTFSLECPAEVGEDTGSVRCRAVYNGPALTEAVTLDWTVAMPNAAYTAAGADFDGDAAPSGTVTFPSTSADGARQDINGIVLEDDTDLEGAERFVVAISSPRAGGRPLPNAQFAGAGVAAGASAATADVTIQASDQPLSVTCEAVAGLGDLNEGALTTAANCHHTNAAALTTDVTVSFEILQGHGINTLQGYLSATPATDFSPNAGTLTLSAGLAPNTARNLQITATDDGVEESAEEFSLYILEATGAGYDRAPLNVGIDLTVAASEAGGPRFAVAESSITDADTETDGTQVGENAGALNFLVSLSRQPAADATVTWGVTGTGIDTAADFTGYPADGSRTLTFTNANWNTAQTVTLTVADDNLNEADETFTIALSAATGADADGNNAGVSSSAGSTDVTITDNDALTFTVARATPASGALNEGGQEVVSQSFTITASGGDIATGATVTVPWAIGADADDATADVDAGDFRADAADPAALASLPGADLAFTAANQDTAQTVTVYIRDDTDAEGDEVFAFNFGEIRGAAGAAAGAGAPIAVTILSSDQALTITCAAVDPLADLVEGTATTVANCRQTTGAALTTGVGLSYFIFAGHGVTRATTSTAELQADFPSQGTVTMPAGTASGTDFPITLTPIADGVGEGAEEFSLVATQVASRGGRYAMFDLDFNLDLTVAASAATNPAFSISVASTVTDADATANGVQVGENVETVAFTVSVAGNPPTADITVDWAITGVDSGDYTTTATSPLTFTAANYQTDQTITLNITDDGVNEATESLLVTLSNAAGTDNPSITAGSDTAGIDITDNDPITFTVARKTPASGAINEGDSQVFSVTPSGGTIAGGTTVTVAWSVGADDNTGTADAAEGDFRASGADSDTTALTDFPRSGTTPLSFTALEAQDVTVWTIDDATSERAETFVFTLGTIDADGQVITAGSPQAVQIAESDVPTFDIMVDTRDRAQFFSPSVGAEGQQLGFIITGRGPAPSASDIVLTCEIDTNSGATTAQAEANDFRELQGDAPATGFPLSVDYGDGAITPTNYNGQHTCSFFAYDDGDPEGREEFTVTLSVKEGLANIGTATAVGAIVMSDFAVGFESATASIDEGQSLDNDGNLNGGNGSVCVAVTSPATGETWPTGVSFSLAMNTLAGTGAGAATAADFGALSNQPVGPFNSPGQRACQTVETAHDVLNEGDETFTINLTPPPGVTLNGVTISPSQAAVTIPANDELVVSISGPAQAEEGTDAEYTLAFASPSATLTSPDGTTMGLTYQPTAATVVTYSLSGTGITTDDFTGGLAALTGLTHSIAAVSPDYTFTLGIAESDPADTPETLSVTVTGATSAGPASAATGSNDNTVMTQLVAAGSLLPRLTVTGPATIAEGGADVTSTNYTVTLSNHPGMTDGVTTITWTVAHGDTAAADFSAVTGTVDLPDDSANEATVNFQITVAADDLNEGDEDFEVNVSADGFNAGAAHDTTITDQAADATAVTIALAATDDAATPAINADADSDAAGVQLDEATAATFTVTLSGGIRTGAITVPFTVSGLDDGEFDITAPTPAPAATSLTHTVTFPVAGATATDSVTVTVDLLTDELNEATETLTVTGAPLGAAGLRIDVGAVQYATGGNDASVAVIDDDAISVSIAVSGTDADGDTAGHQVEEASSAEFTVTIDHASAAAATIPFTIGGEVEAVDYTAPTPLSVTIAAGDTTATITVPILRDDDTDMTENLDVTLTAPNPSATPPVDGPTLATGGGAIALSSTATDVTARAIIIPRGTARTLSITGPTAYTETDDASPTALQYTVALGTGDSNFTQDTTVTWTITDISTELADFSGGAAATDRTGTLMFTSTSTSATVSIIVAGDNVNEAEESFSIQVSVGDATADSGTSYGAPVTTVITDDDAATYSIVADAERVSEASRLGLGGVGVELAMAGFTISIGGDAATSEGDIIIPIMVTGTATTADDYAAPAATVTINAGDTSADLDIALTDDAHAEGEETIVVTLEAEDHASFAKGAAAGAVTLSAATGANSATVIIPENDSLIVGIVRKAGESGAIAEGASAAFTITVEGTSLNPVSVDFDITGTGITAGDYAITAPLGDYDNDPNTPDAAPASGDTLTIAAGADQTLELVIQATDDSLIEQTETLQVALDGSTFVSAGAGTVSLLQTGAASVAITDNDAFTVTVNAAANSGAATEGNSFTIGVSIPSAHTQDVTLTATPGSTAATDDSDAVTSGAGADIGAITGLTIAAGDTSGTVTIPTTNDSLNEGEETFTVTITAVTTDTPGGANIALMTGGSATQTLTVQDDAADAISVAIAAVSSAGDSDATDGITDDEDGEVTFRVTLNGGTRTADVVVPFAFTGLGSGEYAITTPSGINAADTSASVTFGTADTAVLTADIVVNLIGDSLNEATETLTITGNPTTHADDALRTIGAIGYSGGGGNSASATVTDDDPVTYSIADAAAVTEGDTGGAAVNLEFTVTLSGLSAGDVTIPYSIDAASTATGGGTDYTDPSGTVTISPGGVQNNRTATISIPIVHDNLNEADETVRITLGAETDGSFSKTAAAGVVTRASAMADYTASGTIQDDDGITVTLSGGGDVTEGNDATVTVTLGGDTAGAGTITVDYTITAGTATVTDDYTDSAGGSIDIDVTAGLTGAITVAAVDDSLNEADETFSVAVAAAGVDVPGGKTITGSPQNFTIKDNDPIRVTIARAGESPPANVDEDAAGTVDFSVTLSGGVRTAALIVPFSVSGMRIDINDYDITGPGTGPGAGASSHSVTFPVAGATATDSMLITIDLSDDNYNEAAETLNVIGAPAGATGLRFGAARGTLEYAAAANSDRASVVIPANDAITVSIGLAPGTPAARGESASATFRVTLSGGDRTAQVSVPFAFTGSLGNGEYEITAPTGLADTATSGELTFSGAMPTFMDITVNLQDDDVNEGNEDLTLTGNPTDHATAALRGGGGGGIGYASAAGSNAETITITDNDNIAYSIADPAAVTEGSGSGATTTMSFTVSMVDAGGNATASVADISIPFSVGGDATSADYTAPTSPLRITAGATSGTIEFTITRDEVNEGTEEIIVTLGATPTVESGGGVVALSTAEGANTGTGEIRDDDSVTATLSVANADALTVAEGSAAVATVTLSAPAMNTGTITVNYTIGATSATDDNDAEAADHSGGTGGSITIDTANTLTGNITVTTLADALNEGPETFQIAIAAAGIDLPGMDSVAGTPQTFTITDDTADEIEVTIAKHMPTGASVVESGSATFRVSLSGGIRTDTVTVPFNFAGLDDAEYNLSVDGTALTASAFGGDVTFPAPDAAATPPVVPAATDHIDITVDLIDDEINEAAETLTVTGTAAGSSGLRTASGGAISYAASGNTADVGVTDDDAIAVTFPGGDDFNEGNTEGFTVNLDHASAAAVTVNFTVAYNVAGATVSAGTGTTIGAFASGQATGSIEIAAGQTTGDINIVADQSSTVNDNIMHTITVTLTSATVASGGGVITDGAALSLSDTAVITYRGFDRNFVLALAPTDADAMVNIDRDSRAGSPGYQAVEGDTITFMVSIDGTDITAPASVTWVRSGATAELTPSTGGGGSLNFTVANQDTAQTITIVVTQDTINEAAHEVGVLLAGATGGGGAGIGIIVDTADAGVAADGGQALVTVLASDDITYRIADSDTRSTTFTDSADEGNSGSPTVTINLPVRLVGATGSDWASVRIPFTVTGDAGVVHSGAGADYTIDTTSNAIAYTPATRSGTVSFTLGQTPSTLTANIPIVVTADALNEPDETITVTLGNNPTLRPEGVPSRGEILRAGNANVHRGTATINDNDDLTLTIAQTAPAGSADLREGTDVTYRITMSGASQSDVNAVWSATISSQTNTDRDSTAGVNDERPNDMNNADLSAAGANAGSDGGTISGSATITAGATFMDFTIRIRQDARREMRETVTVALSSVTPAVRGVTRSGTDSEAQATFTIAENPAATRFLDIAIADSVTDRDPDADGVQVNEGDIVSFVVTLTGAAFDSGAAAQTVAWEITGVEDSDTSIANSGSGNTLNFGTTFAGTTAPAHTGGLTRTVTTTIVADGLNEASETLTITLGAIAGGSCDITADANCSPPTVANTTSQNVVIAASDAATYSISGSPTVPEGMASAMATFTVTLSPASEGAVTVPFTIDSASTATGGGMDYTDPTLTVMIPAGMTSASLSIAIRDDDLNEADETVIVTLGATPTVTARGGTVSRTDTAANTMATATIDDDDDIQVTVARKAGTEAEVSEGSTAVFEVTLDHMSSGDVTLTYAISGSVTGGAEGDYTDTTTGAGQLVITARQPTGDISIRINADGTAEPAETLTVTLSGPQAAGGIRITDASETVTIPMNPAALHIVTVAGPGAIAEGGGTVQFTFTLSVPGEACAATPMNARTAELVAAFTVGGTATGGGADYTDPSSLTVTFPDDGCTAANNTQTVDIAIINDRIDDDAETIVITLDGLATQADESDETKFPGFAAATGMASVTITDDDTAGLIFMSGDPAAAIPAGGLEVSDGGAAVSYTVALMSQPAAGSVTITPTITPARDPAGITLDMTPLTFTTSNWNTAQEVEVTSATLLASATFTINYAVTANAEAPAYTGITGAVAVDVEAAVTIGGVGGQLDDAGATPTIGTMENPVIQTAGQTATYSIALAMGMTAPGMTTPTPPTVNVANVTSLCVDTVDDTCGGTTDETAGSAVPLSTTSIAGAGLTVAHESMTRHVHPIAAQYVTHTYVNGMLSSQFNAQVRGLVQTQIPVTGTTTGGMTVTRTLTVTQRLVAARNAAVDENLNMVVLPEIARSITMANIDAIAGRMNNFRTGPGGGNVLRFNLGGQSSLETMAANNIQTLAEDDVDWKKILGDSSFSVAGGGPGGGGAFWGGGEYRSIGGESGTTKWSGDLYGGHLGFDAQLSHSTLAGLMVSYSEADIEDYSYTETPTGGAAARTIRGDYTLDMTSASPYLGWRSAAGGLDVWAMASYGEGELEIAERGDQRDDDESLTSDVNMTSFGVGFSGSLIRGNGREVRLKSEAFVARAEVEGGDGTASGMESGIPEAEVDANRVRVMLESSRSRQMESGADFATSAELGMRYDGGDGRTGGGSELGIGARYHNAASGVSLEGRARGLLGHRADYDDWGVSASFKLQPGADGQGLSLELTPAYGQTAAGAQGMWDNGLFAAGDGSDGADSSTAAPDLHARMEILAGYGVKAFTDTGLLTPYSGMAFDNNGKRAYQLGMKWQTGVGSGSGAGGGSGFGGKRFGLGLDFSAKRAFDDTTSPANTFTLKGELAF